MHASRYQLLRDLADKLTDIRHLFNQQYVAHNADPTPWTPAPNTPEVLERINLNRQLENRLAPFDSAGYPLPQTRTVATTYNWSNTLIEDAMQEVRDLMSTK